MAHERFCDPLEQLWHDQDVPLEWNALLVYRKSTHEPFSGKARMLIGATNGFGIHRVETNPDVSGVSLRILPQLGRQAVIASCLEFSRRVDRIIKEEDGTWMLSEAFLLGAAVRGVTDRVAHDDIWADIMELDTAQKDRGEV
jgi:hypothetical protein